MFFKDFVKENFDEKFKIFKQKNIKNYDKKYHTNYVSIKEFENNLNVQLESLIKLIETQSYRFQKLYPVIIENKTY